ncbi:MAG: tetratricopeptide repeat protein [Gemmatimonadales bacterium]
MSHLAKLPPARVLHAAPLGAALILALAPPAAAQLGAGVPRATRLEVTTSSPEARTAFTTGLEDAVTGFPNRATVRLKKAIDADPSFGLARVIHAITAPGLTQAQRAAEIERGVADATKASTGELLVATAYRESFRQNPTGARAILLSAATLLPDEPQVAYQRAVLLGNVTGGMPTDAVVALKAVVERFPDYAPAYNSLAYAQWISGARADAIATATTFMAKAPSHPKSHDTYAELLQWDGNFEAAVAHYRKAIELDATFLGGSYGLSEVFVLQGKYDLARQALAAAVPATTMPAQRATIQSRIANTFVLEGNVKSAMAAVGAMIEEAQKAELTPQVAGGHLALMYLEAAFGDPKTSARAVAAHIGHIAALPPPPAGATPPNPATRFFNNGVAYALAGQPASARVYLDSLSTYAPTVTSPTAARTAANQVHGLTGWVLYSEGKYAEALAEFRQDNSQIPMVRTGIALTQFKLGNVVEARSIRDEVMNDRNLNLANGANVTARRILKVKIT